MVNGLKVVGKNIAEVKLVTSGAGAAALACLNLLLKVGLKRENVFVTDLAGVVYEGREELMDDDKRQYMQKTSAAQAGRGDRGRRRVPRPVGRRRAQARDGRQHGRRSR
jgi:malate dehydrogenase (oxaloacetate-decarboxylating)(NADP+)